MRFRVTFKPNPLAQSLKHCVTLEANEPDPDDGEDCWERVVSVYAKSDAEALIQLKEHMAQEHRECMHVINKAASEMAS